MEAICNERPDSGQQHWIGRASDAQKSAVKVAPRSPGEVCRRLQGDLASKPSHGRGHFFWRYAVRLRERRAETAYLSAVVD